MKYYSFLKISWKDIHSEFDTIGINDIIDSLKKQKKQLLESREFSFNFYCQIMSHISGRIDKLNFLSEIDKDPNNQVNIDK